MPVPLPLKPSDAQGLKDKHIHAAAHIFTLYVFHISPSIFILGESTGSGYISRCQFNLPGNLVWISFTKNGIIAVWIFIFPGRFLCLLLFLFSQVCALYHFSTMDIPSSNALTTANHGAPRQISDTNTSPAKLEQDVLMVGTPTGIHRFSVIRNYVLQV